MRFFLCVAFFTLTFCTIAQDLTSIKNNLDFGDGLENWTTSEMFPTEILSDVPGSKSKYSISIRNDSLREVPYLNQEVELNFDKLMKIEIVGRIKAEFKDSTDRVYAFAYTKKEQKYMQYKMEYLEEGTPVEDWVEIRCEIWIHSRADMLAFGAVLEGQGTIVIDYLDIVVKESESCENLSHLDFRKECISLIMQHSLYKEGLDSLELADEWDQFLGCDTSKAALSESLGSLLKSVDSHSFYMDAIGVQNWENTDTDPDANILMTTGKSIDSSIAYLDMPSLMSGDSVTQVLFADSLQNLIEKLDHHGLKGWVLDIRKNGGGNCWPMLAGIGPILGEGVSGYFEENGNYQAWNYENGVASQDDAIQSSISRSPYLPYIKKPKVAVLVSNRTGSSGEIVALAFKNRDNAQLFGSKTARYTTGNVNFTMSDQSMIFLATSIYCDRLKNHYADGIEPDVAIESTENGDPVLDAAIKWLMEN